MKHLNKLTFLALACYLSSCDTPAKNQTNDATADAPSSQYADAVDQVTAAARAVVDSVSAFADTSMASPSDKKHKHYASVIEMVEATEDFTMENGTLKVLSKSPLHIQISSPNPNDIDLVQLKRNAMEDLVYIAYFTFAKTDISQITITAVPCDADKFLFHQKIVLMNDAATTITISKEKARRVMEAHVGTNNFDDMIGTQVGQNYFPESPSPLLEKLKLTFPVEKVIEDLRS